MKHALLSIHITHTHTHTHRKTQIHTRTYKHNGNHFKAKNTWIATMIYYKQLLKAASNYLKIDDKGALIKEFIKIRWMSFSLYG